MIAQRYLHKDSFFLYQSLSFKLSLFFLIIFAFFLSRGLFCQLQSLSFTIIRFLSYSLSLYFFLTLFLYKYLSFLTTLFLILFLSRSLSFTLAHQQDWYLFIKDYFCLHPQLKYVLLPGRFVSILTAASRLLSTWICYRICPSARVTCVLACRLLSKCLLAGSWVRVS